MDRPVPPTVPSPKNYDPKAPRTPRWTDDQYKERPLPGNSKLDDALGKPKRMLPGMVDEESSARELGRQLSARSPRPAPPQKTPRGSRRNLMNTARGENTVRGESRLDGIVRHTPVEDFEADAKSPGPAQRGLRQFTSRMGQFFSPNGGSRASRRNLFQAQPVDKVAGIRSAVEVLLEAKVNLFRDAVKRFRSDMVAMFIYLAFTALFTVNVIGKSSIKDNYIVRNSVVNTLIDVGAYPTTAFESQKEVGSVDEIFTYLELVVVPNVALANITKLDPRCTELGRDIDVSCDPLVEGQCCETIQPNPSAFVTGGNMLVTPVTIRQLRALQEETETYYGETTQSYPIPWSSTVNEGRDGAGTTKQWDTEGQRIDWPSSEGWYKYKKCTPSLSITCSVSDARATYENSYIQDGFVAQLRGFDTDMLETLELLKKKRFLDPRSTRAVFVDFTAYLPNRKVFVIVSLLFENLDLGQVMTSHTIFVTDLSLSAPLYWIIVEYSVFGFAMLLMFGDVYSMYTLGFSEYWTLGWAVYVSWINYVLFIAALVLRILLDVQFNEIRSIKPMSAEAESYPWLEVAMKEETIIFLTAFNALLTWLRVLSHLEAISPKTRQLTQTISESGGDLASLIVLIFVVLTGFSIGFNVAFGQNVQACKDIVSSLSTLLQAVLGQFDYAALRDVNKIMAPLFFVTYIAIVMFLMLNMFMAVVMKTYDKVTDHLAATSARQVTGTGLLKRQINLLIRVLKAADMEELTADAGPGKKKRQIGLNRGEEDEWEGKEQLTAEDLEKLFGGDEEILNRLSVKTYKELIRLADNEGRHFLPYNEVLDMLNKEEDRAYSQMSRNRDLVAAAAMGAGGVDSSELQLIVDNLLKSQLNKQKLELEAFVQAQMSNLTLGLAGMQQGSSNFAPDPPTEKKPWGGTTVSPKNSRMRDYEVSHKPAASHRTAASTGRGVFGEHAQSPSRSRSPGRGPGM